MNRPQPPWLRNRARPPNVMKCFSPMVHYQKQHLRRPARRASGPQGCDGRSRLRWAPKRPLGRVGESSGRAGCLDMAGTAGQDPPWHTSVFIMRANYQTLQSPGWSVAEIGHPQLGPSRKCRSRFSPSRRQRRPDPLKRRATTCVQPPSTTPLRFPAPMLPPPLRRGCIRLQETSRGQFAKSRPKSYPCSRDQRIPELNNSGILLPHGMRLSVLYVQAGCAGQRCPSRILAPKTTALIGVSGGRRSRVPTKS